MKKVYSSNEMKMGEVLIAEFIDYRKIRKISLHLKDKSDEE
jgi:hypothetical protein